MKTAVFETLDHGGSFGGDRTATGARRLVAMTNGVSVRADVTVAS
jgi:hypothetical protein